MENNKVLLFITLLLSFFKHINYSRSGTLERAEAYDFKCKQKTYKTMCFIGRGP